MKKVLFALAIVATTLVSCETAKSEKECKGENCDSTAVKVDSNATSSTTVTVPSDSTAKASK